MTDGISSICQNPVLRIEQEQPHAGKEPHFLEGRTSSFWLFKKDDEIVEEKDSCLEEVASDGLSKNLTALNFQKRQARPHGDHSPQLDGEDLSCIRALAFLSLRKQQVALATACT